MKTRRAGQKERNRHRIKMKIGYRAWACVNRAWARLWSRIVDF